MSLCGKTIFANFDPCFLNIAASMQKLICQRHAAHEDLAGLNLALSPLLDVFPSGAHLSAFLRQRAIYSLGLFREARAAVEKLAASSPSGPDTLPAAARHIERLTSLFSACLGEAIGGRFRGSEVRDLRRLGRLSAFGIRELQVALGF